MSSYELQFSAPDAQDWQVSSKALHLHRHLRALAHAHQALRILDMTCVQWAHVTHRWADYRYGFSLGSTLPSSACGERGTVILILSYRAAPPSLSPSWW